MTSKGSYLLTGTVGQEPEHPGDKLHKLSALLAVEAEGNLALMLLSSSWRDVLLQNKILRERVSSSLCSGAGTSFCLLLLLTRLCPGVFSSLPWEAIGSSIRWLAACMSACMLCICMYTPIYRYTLLPFRLSSEVTVSRKLSSMPIYPGWAMRQSGGELLESLY